MGITKFLYKDDGYPNFKAIADRGMPFNVILGGRGIGKTYNAFDLCYNNPSFMWMRRGAAEAEATSSVVSAPWKSWFADHDKTFRHYKSGLLTEVWETKTDPETPTKEEDVKRIGYVGALTNFANVRGYDAADVKNLVIDEFIPEDGSHITIKQETKAFLNVCESIGRNRELQGKPPLKVWLLGNTNSIVSNELYMTLGIDRIYNSMVDSGRDIVENRDTGIGVYNLRNSPISEAKRKTSLYKLAAKVSPDFIDMAINNAFSQTDDLQIHPKLSALDVLCVVGSVTVYCLDGKYGMRGLWHLARNTRTDDYWKAKKVPFYPDTKQGLATWYEYFGRYVGKKYKQGLVTYESADILLDFLQFVRKRDLYK